MFPVPCLPFWWILSRSFLVPAVGGIDSVDFGFGFDSEVAFDVVPPDDFEDDFEDDLGFCSRIPLLLGIFANGGV